jgi:single-strand DNA-binding protein
MFNKVILVGNLTRDPELRYLPSGSAVCNTGIATNRRFKTQSGEQKEEVCFIDITLFGRTAEIANQYLNKGKKVLIEGRLKLEQWTDQSGAKRSKHTVTVDTMQMLDGKNQGDEDSAGYDNAPSSRQDQGGQRYDNGPRYDNNSGQNMPKQQQSSGNNSIPEYDVNDDEIPF